MIIGIVGGMGSVATAEYFYEIIKSFPAEKEWERPRIIIDNRCDMPSRVRGILYGEQVDEIVNALSESIKMMYDAGCDYIVLACNTSHYYLKTIIKNHPEYRGKIVHIIDLLTKRLVADGHRKVYLMATEGTYLSRIYDNSFSEFGITYPEVLPEDEKQIRDFIEAVKQVKITDEIKLKFVDFVNSREEDVVVLGCTELPVIYRACADRIEKRVYDPLEETTAFFKKMYKDKR